MVRQLRLILKLIRNRNHQVLLLQVAQVKPSTSKSTSTTSKVSSKPKVIVVYSNYTFNQAVNIQMTKWPQINYGSGWYNASRSDTLKAMNSLEFGTVQDKNIKCLI